MKNVIVTGGAGYIGTHTCFELIENGYQPIVIDNFCNSTRRNIDKVMEMTGVKIPIYESDCRWWWKIDNVFQRIEHQYGEISGVMHFAAYKNVGVSVRKPLDYYENNIASTHAILKCMTDHEIKNFVFSSSCTAYGVPDVNPVVETMSIKPAEAPYGRTKQICEAMINDCVKVHKIRSATLRYFNPIGAHPSGLIGEQPSGIPETLVPYITQVASGLREKLTVFGDDHPTRDGSCIRGFVHIQDIANAHVSAINWLCETENIDPESFNEVFNLGTFEGVSVFELIKAFEDESGVKLDYVIGPRRPGDVSAIYADPSKAKRVLNWKAKLNVNDAMRDAWKWQQTLNSIENVSST